MSQIKKHMNSDFEYKSYGLYSEVARMIGCSSEDVDAVYSWYVNNNLNEMIHSDKVQVFLKGIGTIKIDFGRGLIYLKGYITALNAYTNFYTENKRPSYLRLSYLEKRAQLLQATIESMKRRIVKFREIGAIKEAGFMNKLTRLEQLENQLKTIYESIQRIPEYQQKRTAECGQGSSRSNQQSSEHL